MLHTALISLHSPVVQVVWVYFFLWLKRLTRRFSYVLFWVVRKSLKYVFRFPRRWSYSVYLWNRMIRKFLFLNFEFLQCSYFLLSHFFQVKLVIDELLCSALDVSLGVRHERTLLLLCRLDFSFNIVDFLGFLVRKSFLSANELIFLLVLLLALLLFMFWKH